ncbi:MAG: DUF1015 domain-containing protein [Candidatus Omnitrophota bacterium]
MADIRPFKGARYNQEKIRDISKVMAPPYDVISSKEQDDLYKADPYNIIRMLYGKDFPGDDERENKYTRAAAFMEECRKKGILEKDDAPSIYVNQQEFKVGKKARKRIGFMALLKLEEFDTKTSSVYPHENTLAAPKEDRARLIRAIEANLGPVFAIFEDDGSYIGKILKQEMRAAPLVDLVDSHGIRNKLWRVSDKKTLEDITRRMSEKKIFIADGHHRYEVGLDFARFKNDPRYGYILTYFTDLYGGGLVILPTHRLLGNISEKAAEGLDAELKKHFNVKELGSKKEAVVFLKKAGKGQHRSVIYRKNRFIGLTLGGKKDLDVTIVKDLVIEPLRKKSEAGGGEILIDFTKDLDYAINEVDQARFSLAVLLNPVNITEIRDIAFAGRRMPQKSTYFYPKVLTGLVINKF